MKKHYALLGLVHMFMHWIVGEALSVSDVEEKRLVR
jgi:hypothetical protein